MKDKPDFFLLHLFLPQAELQEVELMFGFLEVSAEEGKFGVNLVQEAVLVPAWVGGGWGVWWEGCLVGGVFGGWGVWWVGCLVGGCLGGGVFGGWGVWWVGCLVGGVFGGWVFGGRVFGGRFLVDVYGWLVGVWWVGGGW